LNYLLIVGSGNIGATNASRALGKKWGAVILLLDALKSFLPTFFALRHASPEIAAAVGIAGVVGHVYPIWLRFRGGKGVATAFGVYLAIAPLFALASFAVYAIVVAAFRISSLGSLVATSAMLVAMLVRGQQIILAVALWALIVFKHRDNVARLLRGEEKRV
jgi:glycerol-3-phosphate acyltransferase PlsY